MLGQKLACLKTWLRKGLSGTWGRGGGAVWEHRVQDRGSGRISRGLLLSLVGLLVLVAGLRELGVQRAVPACNYDDDDDVVDGDGEPAVPVCQGRDWPRGRPHRRVRPRCQVSVDWAGRLLVVVPE